MFKMSIWYLRATGLLMLLALFAAGSSHSYAQISPPPSSLGAILAQTPPVPAMPPALERVIKEYRVGRSPNSITVGPDGALWFTEFDAATIGRITTTGDYTPYHIRSGSKPVAITSGPNRELWFTAIGTDSVPATIGHITTDGTFGMEVPLAHSSFPRAITVGPDNGLWFTEELADSIGHVTVSGVDPATGTAMANLAPGISLSPTPGVSVGIFPYGITMGPDNKLWFTERGNEFIDPTVGHEIRSITVNPTTGVGTLTDRVPLPVGSLPRQITTGPGPNPELWFTEGGSTTVSPQIGHLSTARVLGTPVLLAPNSSPEGITKGPDSTIWFTEPGTNRIGRITTTGTFTDYPLGPSTGPTGITLGPDSKIWFTEFAANRIGNI